MTFWKVSVSLRKGVGRREPWVLWGNSQTHYDIRSITKHPYRGDDVPLGTWHRKSKDRGTTSRPDGVTYDQLTCLLIEWFLYHFSRRWIRRFLKKSSTEGKAQGGTSGDRVGDGDRPTEGGRSKIRPLVYTSRTRDRLPNLRPYSLHKRITKSFDSSHPLSLLL